MLHLHDAFANNFPPRSEPCARGRPALTVSTQPAATSVERALTRMAESPEVMNIRQASQYLGISPDTLYKYVYEEKIPAFKLGNRWKFKKTILDSWMEKKSLGGNAEDKGKKRPKAAAARAGSGTARQTM